MTWSTEILQALIGEAKRKKMVILKIHSHQTEFSSFSSFDDESDEDLFKGFSGWIAIFRQSVPLCSLMVA
ncbi:hypothetical protein [Metabacillus sp. Hm71]|uniref:hypothetical protein n=1 Tax=Metabacillus sp. Hm71 TaxID=3450743 RepID=UPI003F42C5CE